MLVEIEGGERLFDIDGIRVLVRVVRDRAAATQWAQRVVTEGICSVAAACADTVDPGVVVCSYGIEGLQTTVLEGADLAAAEGAIAAARVAQTKDDLTAHYVERVERAIDRIARVEVAALSAVSSELIEALASVLGLRSHEPGARAGVEFLRIAVFVVFDAMLYHDSVAGRSGDLSSLTAPAPHGRRAHAIENWRRILSDEYAAIFRLALRIVEEIPHGERWDACLDELAALAFRVRGSGVLARHDFVGRLFHKILLRSAGDSYATYYTGVPSAYLLSRLAVGKMEGPFDDARVASLRVADLACGSGTLLSAAYSAIRDRYVAEAPARDVGAMHRALVEGCMYGLDVLDYAAHLTLTTLAMHNAAQHVGSSHVRSVPVGSGPGGTVHVGSLELYFEPGWSLPPFDLVIMNPPFSRSAKPKTKFAFDPGNAKKLNDRLKTISKREGFRKLAIAGLGAYFVPLAVRLAKDGGRVAFVLPRALLSGVAWEEARRAIERECHIEYVVSNCDPVSKTGGIKPWAFSEETALGEVMFVAKKRVRSKDAPGEMVRFVNLCRFPEREYEAISAAGQVLEANGVSGAIRSGGAITGTWNDVAQASLAGRNWLWPCLFAHPGLLPLVRGVLECASLVPLGDLADGFGCDISAEKKAFAQTDAPNAFPMLWTHGVRQNTLRLKNEQLGFGKPLASEAKAREFFAGKSARLLVAERPHLKTTPTFALLADRAVLGTPFWETRLREDAHGELVAMYLNSTFGIVGLLANATNSQGEIFKLKRDQIERVPVVNPANVDAAAARDLWNVCAERPLANLQQSWLDAARGRGLRYELDAFFAPHLPHVRLTTAAYAALASEPAVCYRRLERLA